MTVSRIVGNVQRLPVDLNTPPRGECARCHRKFWKAETAGGIDSMVQPDGGICGGRFVAYPVKP